MYSPKGKSLRINPLVGIKSNGPVKNLKFYPKQVSFYFQVVLVLSPN